MADLREKVAYFRGLLAGVELGKEAEKTRPLWDALADVLGEVASQTDLLAERLDEQEEYLDALDTDLADLEEDIFEEEEDDFDSFVEIECPYCGTQVAFEEDLLDDSEVEVRCQECDELVFAGDNGGEEESDVDQCCLPEPDPPEGERN